MRLSARFLLLLLRMRTTRGGRGCDNMSLPLGPETRSHICTFLLLLAYIENTNYIRVN